jgi:transcriptional regulator GlxA family with amidase domain
MRSVAIAIFPGLQALDVAGPVDVFAETNNFVASKDAYEITLVSTEAGAVGASNGTRLFADLSCEQDRGHYDIALVTGGPGLPAEAPDASLIGWLNHMAAKCGRYGSICMGSFALGHAGLLDEHPVFGFSSPGRCTDVVRKAAWFKNAAFL